MRFNLQIFLFILFFHQFGYAQDEAAKEFQFHTENGESHKLSDYKGEVVYISFWASWCKPCIVNFERYYQMRKELAEIGVVLLNVNLDKSKEKWHSSLAAHEFLIGENVRADQINELMTLYNLNHIPAYEIINKQGFFVYLPEDGKRDIKGSFQEWIIE